MDTAGLVQLWLQAASWPMMATTIATPAMATAITIILASDGCQYLAATILMDMTTLMISIIILLLVDTSSTGKSTLTPTLVHADNDHQHKDD